MKEDAAEPQENLRAPLRHSGVLGRFQDPGQHCVHGGQCGHKSPAHVREYQGRAWVHGQQQGVQRLQGLGQGGDGGGDHRCREKAAVSLRGERWRTSPSGTLRWC